MKEWYPSLALGALLFILCSMSIPGTLNALSSADNLTKNSAIIETTLDVPSVENNINYYLMAADSQVINMPLSAYRKDKIKDCEAINLFQTRYEHLYPDTVAHRDTLTICPPNNTKRVFITFTDFELAPGDTLCVYDSDTVDITKQVAAYSGVGVGVTGGWIRSECNPSGCLTFEFKTNGDNIKGKGWEAWVKCDSLESTKIVCPDIPSVKLDCEDDPFAIIEIQRPTAILVCGQSLDTFCLTILSQNGMTCLDSCIGGATLSITDTFAIGLYKATWTSKKYPTYKVEKIFSVQGPTLVCNDQVFVPLGSACILDITPDMLLEHPCDTINDTMYYRIEFTIGIGPKKKTFAGGGGPGIPYPSIERAALVKYGAGTICGGGVEVTISQVYYEHLDSMSICNVGEQEISCTTDLNFADQSPPFFVNYGGLDTVIACDTTGLMNALKTPLVYDNCDTATITLREVKVTNEGNVCGAGKVLVIWEAVDLCGNRSTLEDSIFLKRPAIENFSKPGRTIVNCNEGLSYRSAMLPGIVRGELRNGVLIPRDTVPLSTTEYICGYILIEKDKQYPSPCGEKWVRSWKVLDWCEPNKGPEKIAIQTVEITDTLAPTFIDCPDSNAIGGANKPMEVALGHFECSINMTPERLGIPNAIDNCDPSPTVTMFCVEESWAGTWRKIGTNLSNSGALFCDTFRIGWVANDICPEQLKQDTCYKYVIIKDVTRPTAVCTDQINFSVGSDWARIVGVDDVDAGSWDACGIARKEISFDGINWDTLALLDCDAIHQQPKLHLRVTDTKGNQNTCWTIINVKDDIHPSCGKLPDVSEFCDQFQVGDLGASTDTNENGLFDESEYLPLEGEMLASFNQQYGDPINICDDNVRCTPMTIEQEYQLVEWPCGQTRIQRRYRATDWGPNSSNWETQLIALKYRPNWTITLPADWDGECGEKFPDANIDITFGTCDQIAWEHEDKVFEITDGACYKVERTYHIINWCLYKAGNKPFPLARREDDHGFVESSLTINADQYRENGYFTYIQILKVHSFEAPEITINEVESCLLGQGDAFPYGEEDTTPGAAPYECDDIRTFSVEATTCVPFATLNFAWCLSIDNIRVDSGMGSKFNYPVEPGRIYKVRFKVGDGCGNRGFADKEYEFFDCKKPTPYCRAGLGIEMGQEGKIAIWATDIDLNSFDNCTPKNRLFLRLWHVSLGAPPSNVDGVLALPSKIDFDCNNFGNQILRLYVLDENENWAYCATTVNVQDNMNVCEPFEQRDAFVSGRIHTANDYLLNDVTVTAISSNGSSIATVTKNGGFQLTLPKSFSYSLRPEMDDNPLNGVTTFDLVLISKHILGHQSFNSPYQHIAADINQSGTISAYDMVQLRQLILSITTSFPNNTSWKFVDEAYTFAQNEPASENYPQTVELSNMEDLVEASFMAVKIGDINQSANFTQAESAKSRGFASIQVEDRQLEVGETYMLDFILPAGKSVQGYQFTLDYGDLELIDLVEATTKAYNFGFNLKERGVLTTSWNAADGATDAASPTKLFSLVIKPQKAGLLSEKLSINSSVTIAEAYDADDNNIDVKLQFIGNKSSGIQLYQNRPNPFRANTSIGFYLPEAGEASLSILNVQGKVLKEIKGSYKKGYQEIQINARDFTDKGVLYYYLTTDKKQVIKRMIVVE